jgi:hypothetical protein
MALPAESPLEKLSTRPWGGGLEWMGRGSFASAAPAELPAIHRQAPASASIIRRANELADNCRGRRRRLQGRPFFGRCVSRDLSAEASDTVDWPLNGCNTCTGFTARIGRIGYASE